MSVLAKAYLKSFISNQGYFLESKLLYSITKFPNIPTAWDYPLIGSTIAQMKSGPQFFHLYVDRKHKLLGPIFKERVISSRFIALSDPNEIRKLFSIEGKYPKHFLPSAWLVYNKLKKQKRGILFMDGPEWLHYRKILNKHLLKGNIVSELSVAYEDVSNSLIKQWETHNGKCIERLEKDLYIHSLSFMLATAMGSSYVHFKNDFTSEIEHMASTFQGIFNTTSKLMILPINFSIFLKLSSWKQFCAAMDESLRANAELIKKVINISSSDGLIQKLLNDGVEEELLTRLIIDLMMAAGDTTVFTTLWALYLLGLEDKDRQRELCESDEKVKCVIKETMRLYPAAPFITRILGQPVNIFGYDIPPGEVIVMSIYTCGRDENNFKNANTFWPERWLRDEKGNRLAVNNINAFLPFAMGARSCVGKKIAEAQMAVTISKVSSMYQLKTMKEVDMVLRLIPAPAEDVKIHIQKHN